MKKRFVVALAVVCSSLGVVTGGLVAHAGSTPGVPEIDRANVKVINLQGPTLTGARCTGEDAMGYITYTGGPFTGGVNQILPDPTDYPVPANSPLTLSGIVWTVNFEDPAWRADRHRGNWSGVNGSHLLRQAHPGHPGYARCRCTGAGPGMDQRQGHTARRGNDAE